ncbi:hypothetical protein SAMD00019534_028720, partial [Acytostelium subglobosum LB1]|uniref:hypothetical protein n=1 Tax=Acytostelium subglobosum LB1 TaxID=1410327 RepID=UPI000644E43A
MIPTRYTIGISLFIVLIAIIFTYNNNSYNFNSIYSFNNITTTTQTTSTTDNNKMRSIRNLATELMKEDGAAHGYTPARFAKLKREYARYYALKAPDNAFQFTAGDWNQLYVPTSFDRSTCEFVLNTPRWNAVTSAMNWLMMFWYTKTDSMGYIGMGNMFILSTDQYRSLFRMPTITNSHTTMTTTSSSSSSSTIEDDVAQLPTASPSSLVRLGSLLDVGSGCGSTTEQLAPIFREVVTTEASNGMLYSLRKKGFEAVYCTDLSTCTELADRRHTFDVVSCLNVLDRCERPLTLLRSLKDFVKPGGRILIAVVFPFKPYVEFGGEDNKPFEKLDVNNKSCEEYIDSFITKVFNPLGFHVESFTRAPYISEGDKYYDNYVLTDTLFVLSIANEGETMTT